MRLQLPRRTWHSGLRAGLCALALLLVQEAVHSEPGVTSTRIALGMTAPLSGPLSHYGLDLAKGLRLGLEQQNAAGGIAGRRIELRVRDDAGRPDRAAANVQALLDEGVLAFTGLQGASSVAAVLPLIEKSGVLLVGAATGAESLREPPLRHVFNLRAGAREETAAMVLHLDTIGITEIATIAQDDELGSAALEGVQFELTRLAVRPLALVRLPVQPSPADVDRAVQAACKAKPQAMVLGLHAANVRSVIRAARKADCSPRFYAMSEAGAELLATGVPGAPGELAGVVVSQVLPHPHAASVLVAADYVRLAGATPTYAGLEGFIYGRVIAEGLRRCATTITRQCLGNALESRAVDVGGYRVEFRPPDRRGSRFVDMTIITPDGRFRR